jgi:tetratricopeptide (TPR) repeat protein
MSTALAEMLTTELANGKGLRAVPGDAMSRVRSDLDLTETTAPNAAALAQIRSRLGVEYLVAGAYTALGEPGKGQLRVDLRLLDATTGEIRLDVSEEGPQADLIRLAGRAGEKLRRQLGATAPASAGLWSPERWTPEATRLYSEGLARLRAFDVRGARDSLEQAVAADPKSPHVRAALAEAWTALGYGEKGRAEATRALELAADLPDEQRLPIEAACRQKFGEWQLAADLYRRLVAAAPDDVDVGLHLVSALAAAGRLDEASAEVNRLAALPAGASDARVALAAASVAERRGEYPAQLAAARRALELASGQNAREYTARAQLGIAAAQRSLGQPEPAGQAAAQARQTFAAIGDGAGETAALLLQGSAAFDRGDLETAVARSSDAVARARSLGDAQATASALNTLAVAVRNQGDLERAGSLYEEALAATREIAAKPEEATILHNLGALQVQRGQLEVAGQHFEKALAMWKALGDSTGTATALASLGGLLERQGDLPAARARFDEAIALRRSLGQQGAELAASVGVARLLLAQGDVAGARERFTAALDGCRATGISSCVAHALSGLGAVALEGAQFEAARSRYTEVLKNREASGEKVASAETRVALAAVADAEGRAREAVQGALQSMNELREHGAQDAAALAGAVLLRAAVNAGDRAAAQSALGSTQEAWARTASPAVRIAGLLAQARWIEAQGSRRTALDIAHEAGTLATRHGLILLALEARSLAAKLSQDRATLAAIRQEAAAKGLARIAQL